MEINRLALEKTDLQGFDTVPDGILRYAELKDSGQLALFIRQFLQTSSEEIASEFFSRMDYPLRTAIRGELIKIIQAPPQTSGWALDDVKRFQSWLDHWFVEQHLGVSFNTQYAFSSDQSLSNYSQRENNLWVSHQYQRDQSLHDWGNTLGVNGDLSWEGMKIFGGLHFFLHPQLGASSAHLSSDGGDKQEQQNKTAETNSKKFGLSPTLGIMQEEERYSLFVSGNFERYEDPLPDSLGELNGFSGQASLRRPLDWPFEVNGNFSWSRQLNTQPLDTQLAPGTTESFPFGLTATYQLKETLGAVGEYWYNRSESVSRLHENFFSSHEGSLLAQIKTGEASHIRLGGGGGLQESEYQTNQGGIYQNYQTARIHSKASWKWNLTEKISSEAEGEGTANYVEGTLMGWYPSARFREGISLSFPEITLNFSMEWRGFWRDVYYKNTFGPADPTPEGQKYTENHSWNTSLGFSYRPSDAWDSSLFLGHGLTRDEGFQPADSDNINVNGSVSTRLFLEPVPTWLWIGGSYFWNDSAFGYQPPSDYSSDIFAVRGGMNLRY